MSGEPKKSKAAHGQPHITGSNIADPRSPRRGDLVIDASAVAPFLIDLPQGAMQGMRTEQDGFDEVVEEIVGNQPKHGDAAGVTAADIALLQTSTEQIALIDKYLGPAEKLVELLTETRAKLDDARQRKVYTIANTVDIRAKDRANDDLRVAYEKTRAYRSASGTKAAKTRQKKAATAGAASPKPTNATASERSTG